MDKNSSFAKILFTFILMLGLNSAFAALDDSTKWDGKARVRPQQDSNGVFVITSAAELAWLSDSTNTTNAGLYKIWGSPQQYKVNMRLDADLDMGNHLFFPICGGSGDKKFQGVFDGNGHVISNLFIDGDDLATISKEQKYAQNVGFIGAMGGGTVKNLVIENADIQSSANAGIVSANSHISVGVIVGWQENGTIQDCMTTGSIQTSGKKQGIGGIAGNVHQGTIQNCLSTVSIHASGETAQIGGIVGLTKKNRVTIQSCVYAGTSLKNSGSGNVGAILGEQSENNVVVIKDCYYDTDVVSKSVGNGKSNLTDYSQGVDEVNFEQHICAMNGGELVDGECSENSPWSVGENSVSLNGSDGFKVVFNANGGTFADGDKVQKIVHKGEKISAEEIGIPVHADSAFAGWSLDKNATEPDADLGFVSKATTVYAVWYPIYTITFSAVPGAFPDGEVEKTLKVAKNEKITVGELKLPFSYTDENNVKFYFTGWAETANAPESDTIHVLPQATKNMTLYAVWTLAETYTVTYNGNGHGKTQVDYVRVASKKTTDAPADPEADAGYKFIWWYTEDGCVNKFNFETTLITKNWTLYAKWEKENYIIDYVLDDGLNNEKNPTSYNIESETIELKAPTKEGFEFVGWFYDKDFTRKARQITKGSTGDITLYAKWKAIVFKVYYYAGTNSSFETISSDTKVYGKPIRLKGEGVFTREGYTQDGWSLTDGGEKVYVLGAYYGANADIALYPHWVQGLTVERYGAVTIYKYPDNKVTAVIDGVYKDTGAVKITEDIKVDEVTFVRWFDINTSSTIMLPFSMDASKVKGGKFYRFKRVEGERGHRKVYISKITTSYIGANTPYIVLPESPELTFEGGAIFNTETDPSEVLTNGAWEFVGVNEYTLFKNHPELGNVYGFAGQERDGIKVGHFVEVGSGVTSPALRAYLVEHTLSKSLGGTLDYSNRSAEEFDVVIVDENDNVIETGKMNSVTGVIRMDRWYDLKGRVLNSKPTARGTYYYKGKRVIIK